MIVKLISLLLSINMVSSQLTHTFTRDSTKLQCLNYNDKFTIRLLQPRTEAQCVELCDGDNECQTAMWNGFNNKCWLLRHCYAMTKYSQFVVNHKHRDSYTPIHGQQCSIGDSTMILPNDTPITEYQECQDLCDGQPTCVTFNVVGSERDGSLKCRTYADGDCIQTNALAHTIMSKPTAPPTSLPTGSPTTLSQLTNIPTASPTSALTPLEFQEITNTQIRCANPNNKYMLRRVNGLTPEECADKCNNNADCVSLVYNDIGQCVENKFCEHKVTSRVSDFYIASRKSFEDISNPGKNITTAVYIGQGCVGVDIDQSSVTSVKECVDLCVSTTSCDAFTVTSDGRDPVGFFCTLHVNCNDKSNNVLSTGYDIISRTIKAPTIPPTVIGETFSPTANPTISPVSSPFTQPPSTTRPTSVGDNFKLYASTGESGVDDGVKWSSVVFAVIGTFILIISFIYFRIKNRMK